MKINYGIPCVVLLAAVVPAYTQPAKTLVFRAGAAASNITPPLGSPIVGGFLPFPATHVHDELHARCLVLDDGKTKLVFVVCDLLGIDRSVSDEARADPAARPQYSDRQRPDLRDAYAFRRERAWQGRTYPQRHHGRISTLRRTPHRRRRQARTQSAASGQDRVGHRPSARTRLQSPLAYEARHRSRSIRSAAATRSR